MRECGRGTGQSFNFGGGGGVRTVVIFGTPLADRVLGGGGREKTHPPFRASDRDVAFFLLNVDKL